MEIFYVITSVFSLFAFYKYARYDERLKWEIEKIRKEEKKISSDFQLKYEELIKEKDNLLYEWELYAGQLQQDLEVSAAAQIAIQQKPYMIYNMVYFLHFTLGCIISPENNKVYLYNETNNRYDIEVGKLDKDPSKVIFNENRKDLKRQYQNYINRIEGK